MNKCKIHPSYKGNRPPKVFCKKCLSIYNNIVLTKASKHKITRFKESDGIPRIDLIGL